MADYTYCRFRGPIRLVMGEQRHAVLDGIRRFISALMTQVYDMEIHVDYSWAMSCRIRTKIRTIFLGKIIYIIVRRRKEELIPRIVPRFAINGRRYTVILTDYLTDPLTRYNFYAFERVMGIFSSDFHRARSRNFQDILYESDVCFGNTHENLMLVVIKDRAVAATGTGVRDITCPAWIPPASYTEGDVNFKKMCKRILFQDDKVSLPAASCCTIKM